MISCYTIGSNGRLGNQMFQLAAVYGIAKKKNTSFSFSPGRLYEAFTLEGIQPSELSQNQEYLFREPAFSFFEPIFTIPDGTEIHGYFQSERYWQHVKEDIVRAFKVRDEHLQTIPRDLVDFCGDSTFVHVRRGDYLATNGFHPTFDEEFYVNAAGEPGKVSIFSDDVDWCQSLVKKFEERGFETCLVSSLGLSDIQEFHLMTLCRDAVISNSTFSWWAAYLGPHQKNGKVSAPKVWFGEIGHKDTQDIYVPGWSKV